MKLALAAVSLWFLASAFMILIIGSVLWFARKFSPMKSLDSTDWAHLTAFGLLAPTSSGIALAAVGLISAMLCPYISANARNLCLHSVKHFCAHSTAMAIWERQFLLWGTGIWLAVTGTATTLVWKRRRTIKFLRPSAKLMRAIALAKLPTNLPVWETDCGESAGLVGVVSPSIFVPKQLVHELPVSALSVVLQHEYAHFVRRDHLVRFLLFIVALVFAPVPFAIWLQREWRYACEKAADDFAMRDKKSAQFLSTALRTFHEVSGLEGNEHLQSRIERVERSQPINLRTKWAGTAVMVIGLVLIASIFQVPAVWLTFHCLAEALVQ